MTTYAYIAAALLVLYVTGIAYALIVPPKQHDPQRGMAVGCLMIVILGLLGMGGLLALAVAFDWPWIVNTIFWYTAFPAIIIAVQGVRWLFIRK